MDTSLCDANDLLALLDEEVLPLAAEMAASSAHLDVSSLRERLRSLHAIYHRTSPTGGSSRTTLVDVIASATVLLAAVPRDVRLAQQPSDTRAVDLSEDDFRSFRLGRLRHATFRLGVYRVPKLCDVVRLLEVGPGGWTGRDVLAEVLHVSDLLAGGESLYVVSLRPWRGAGTASFEEAHLRERRTALLTVRAALERMARLPVVEHAGVDESMAQSWRKLHSVALQAVAALLDSAGPARALAAE